MSQLCVAEEESATQTEQEPSEAGGELAGGASEVLQTIVKRSRLAWSWPLALAS